MGKRVRSLLQPTERLSQERKHEHKPGGDQSLAGRLEKLSPIKKLAALLPEYFICRG